MNKKIYIYPGLYWLIFFAITLLLFPLIIKDGGLFIIFLLLYPFTYIIVYLFIKPKDKSEKNIILIEFFVPLFVIYLFYFLQFKNSFHPGF